MMDFILFFFVAFISFAGSIQLGAVNLAVIQTTLNRGRTAGILVAIGGSIPEIIYATLALKGLSFLQNNEAIIKILNLLIIPVFLIIGLLNIFQKSKNIEPLSIENDKKKVNFIKGFLLGMLNPQLLPFWFFVLVYLRKYFIISSLSTKVSFVLGTASGAFAILFLFGYLAQRYRHRFEIIIKKYSFNKIFGYLFIGLAIFQAIKYFV